MLKLKKLLTNVSRLSRQITTTSRLASDELNIHRDSEDNNYKTPFEFSEANLMRIGAIIKNYPMGAQRAAVLPVLDIAQRQIGWVPISAMHKVAELLSMPRIRVYEVSTFYTMFKRTYRGKYHVKVCVSTPCMLRGSDYLVQVVENACCCCVGNISSDGMFGVDIVQCQGACVNAPMMVVDDDYYEDLTENDVYDIIMSIKTGGIPRPGPQNGRLASEPICGFTSLRSPPPQPGHGLQPTFQ